MKNLTIEQQKEFERLMNQINILHAENDELLTQLKTQQREDNNIKLSLKREIDKLHKQNLELIRDNNKLNKKISSYEKYNDLLKDIPSDEEIEKQYKEYYSSLENELYCE